MSENQAEVKKDVVSSEITKEEKRESAPITPKVEAVAPIRPEVDKSKTHKERIISFVEGKRGQGTIKLNDFLKSLYPLPKGNEPQQHLEQGNLRKLRQDIRELKAEGKLNLNNDSFEQLGNPHFPDQTTGRTHYKNLTDTPIEAIV